MNDCPCHYDEREQKCHDVAYEIITDYSIRTGLQSFGIEHTLNVVGTDWSIATPGITVSA